MTEQQTFSISSLTPELSQAQLWLNQVYPKEQRSQMKHLEISEKRLQGFLDLTDFVSLEELYCYNNQLTEIKSDM